MEPWRRFVGQMKTISTSMGEYTEGELTLLESIGSTVCMKNLQT